MKILGSRQQQLSLTVSHDFPHIKHDDDDDDDDDDDHDHDDHNDLNTNNHETRFRCLKNDCEGIGMSSDEMLSNNSKTTLSPRNPCRRFTLAAERTHTPLS